MAFAHFFGAGWLMTAWTMGFKVPNLARRLFGEGAASASFIPVYSEEIHRNPKDANRLACTVVTVIFVILAAIVVIGQLTIWTWYWLFETRTGPRLGLALCSIMLPYMIFVCIVAILAGILNVHRHFANCPEYMYHWRHLVQRMGTETQGRTAGLLCRCCCPAGRTCADCTSVRTPAATSCITQARVGHTLAGI